MLGLTVSVGIMSPLHTLGSDRNLRLEMLKMSVTVKTL
jgi:hypothetical protein